MSYRDLLRARPPLRLADIDPRATPGFTGDKAAGRQELAELLPVLDDLQTRLYATRTHGLLVVLQGRDAAGKDGILRHVVGAMSPVGFRAHPFGPPTEAEAAHDFLWRGHRRTPGRGEVVVFNRSHYEDVLVRRVRRLDPPERWQPRYAAIRDLERVLHQDGDTVVVKILPHISRDEQARRLEARLRDRAKRWKLRREDLEDRALWSQYDAAYEDALRETDTDGAPWYIVPADRKWYRDLAVAHLLRETLDELHLQYPEPPEDLSDVRID